MKVCLVGEEGVGKTSLIRRFVHADFGEKYLRTVGTMVSKKVVAVGPIEGTAYTTNLLVWDIMGRRDFMALYKDAYFSGARGIIAVCDLTRPGTLEALHDWLESIVASIGQVPIVVLGNKKDMGDHVRVGEDDLVDLCDAHPLMLPDAPYLLTSARTGENVETAFSKLSEMAVRARLVERETRIATRAGI